MNTQNPEPHEKSPAIEAPDIASPPPGSRDVDVNDMPPPMTIAGRGPMDQSTPDVATGSTPVTRRDD